MNLTTAISALVAHLRNNDEETEGQSLVEYSLILVLIAVVSITILTTLGTKVSGVFQQISGGLGS
jgi:pilus assembly protein Flp/PilA